MPSHTRDLIASIIVAASFAACGATARLPVDNERDELGSDLVPDYMTAVREGGFTVGRAATSASTSIAG
jgi:hypothetical protein